jgi:hypothetical protein
MPEPVVLGGAKECIAKDGKWDGRSQSELAGAIKEVMLQKSRSLSGVVSALCVSPINGSRLPREELQAKQSILGDCQSEEGWAAPASAKIKNNGALLGKDNLFVESLLAAVSIGDADIVQEVVSGARAPRLEEVWVTGDNIYVSGLDMSWNNFRIGDLLVMPGAVIVNTGYPHFACWKYAVRAGEHPKSYINSEEGVGLRMRGIKGSFLLRPSSKASATIRITDSVRIVHKDTPDYDQVTADCSAPLPEGTEITFQTEGNEVRASADDTKAYIDLLVLAGSEAGRLDFANYNRALPDIVKQELGLVGEEAEKPTTMPLSPATMSGDGSTVNVGVKTDGKFQCQDCVQRFGSEKALLLHWKFNHDPDFHYEG